MAENLPTRSRTKSAATPKPPRPPKHLSAEAKKMWRGIVDEWVLGRDALPLLQAACEQWMQYREAHETLATEGLTVRNEVTGMTHRHPAHSIARDALREFRMLFRQLGLEPPSAPGGRNA